MIKKENKIIVIVSPDFHFRQEMIRRLIVRMGFARIPSDAAKIVTNDIHSIDLATAYFVFCSGYNLRSSTVTTQRLYELSARGIAVVVGVSKLPREYEFCCQAFYPEDFPNL